MKKSFLKKYSGVIILVLLVLSPVFYYGIPMLITEISLAPYHSQITECIEENEHTNEEPTLRDIEKCAVEVAAEFYVDNPKNAIQLCIKYLAYPHPNPEFNRGSCISKIQQISGVYLEDSNFRTVTDGQVTGSYIVK